MRSIVQCLHGHTTMQERKQSHLPQGVRVDAAQ